MGITDLEGNWCEVNPAIEHMLGHHAADMLGRSAFDYIYPEDVQPARDRLAALVDGKMEASDNQVRYLRRDGEVVWVQSSAAVLQNPGGSPLYVMVQLRDVSAEHEARSLQEASDGERAAAAEIANHQLQLFADAVTHDLRAPLRSIESFSSLLAHHAGDALDETSQAHLSRIRNAAGRMSSLLAALSDLSGATRAKLSPGPVDISLLADWAAAELQDADPERSAEILVQPGLVAHGDEHLLKLLLVQLLDNAWKFSGDQATVRIEVTGSIQGQVLKLSVTDHGRGFDTQYAHKLFEPFQRLHGPEEGGGHGLGLAIAQRIADRHGGSIEAESEPGVGATFHLQLPTGRAGGFHDDT